MYIVSYSNGYKRFTEKFYSLEDAQAFFDELSYLVNVEEFDLTLEKDA